MPSGYPKTVPLAADLPAACILLRQRPAQARCHRDFPMHTAAPAAAQLFVRESSTVSSVPYDVSHCVELVANELVTNAVQLPNG
jgi:hypothetical protein